MSKIPATVNLVLEADPRLARAQAQMCRSMAVLCCTGALCLLVELGFNVSRKVDRRREEKEKRDLVEKADKADQEKRAWRERAETAEQELRAWRERAEVKVRA